MLRFRGLLALLFILSCTSNPQSQSDRTAASEGSVSGEAVTPSSAIPDRRDFPVDHSVDPCSDFYAYACNKVRASFKLRDDRSRHTFAFSDSIERLREAKQKYLKSLGEKKKLSRRAQSYKNYFDACMDESASKKEELEVTQKLKSELNAIQSREGFQKYLAGKILSGQESLVYVMTIANQENPLMNDVYLATELKNLPERSYYEKEAVIKDLQDLYAFLFQSLGESDAENRAKRVVEFEKEFAKIYPTPVEIKTIFRSPSVYISKADMLKEYPAFQLNEVLKRIPDKKVALRSFVPGILKFLNDWLSKEALAVLKDVYMVRTLSGLMDDAYPDYFKKSFDFKAKHLGGPIQRPVREERCTSAVTGGFSKEIDADLLPLIFPAFPEQKVRVLAEKVRASIIDGISKNNWLTPESKAGAVEKIKVATLQLVKPRNDKEWDFNIPAKYSKNRPYSNSVQLSRLKIEKSLKELGKNRDPKIWSSAPLTVNAWYNPTKNTFTLPIGILQYPMFDASVSEEANLGAIGVIVGHELGHSVDNSGANFDKMGRLKQWMSDADVKEFQRRGAKLIDQFNKIGHNGEQTLGENIADLVGVSFSFAAAFGNGDHVSVEKKKNFFLGFARVWCDVSRPGKDEQQLKTGYHSLAKARVNEQVKHQGAFAEAFACKANSPMTLSESERVRIW